MILADTLKCVSAAEPPNLADLMQPWVTTIECEMGTSSFPWATLWQGLAAAATLVAVGIAVWQTKNAQKAAEEANAERKAAQLQLHEHASDERYRRASRLSAWVEIAPSGTPQIQVMNGSEDVLYDVTIHHHGLVPLGFTSFPIVAPGFVETIPLSRWYPGGPNMGKEIPPGLVHTTLTDALGHTYERRPENKGILSETGPCYD